MKALQLSHFFGKAPKMHPAVLGSTTIEVSIKKINMLQRNMLSSLETVLEPDYLGEFIERGGLVGLEPQMPLSQVKKSEETQRHLLVQSALNHARLESLVKKVRQELTEAFGIINQGLLMEEAVVSEGIMIHSLAKMITCKESAKNEMQSLVLRQKEAQSMYNCLDFLDKSSNELEEELSHCMRLRKARQIS